MARDSVLLDKLETRLQTKSECSAANETQALVQFESGSFHAKRSRKSSKHGSQIHQYSLPSV